MSDMGPIGNRLRARLLVPLFACAGVLAALALMQLPEAPRTPELARSTPPQLAPVPSPLPVPQPSPQPQPQPQPPPPPAILDRLPDIRLQRRAAVPDRSLASPYLLRLKSGAFELLPGAPFAVRGDREYLVAQFREEPTAADRLELERLGARILDYLPDRAFVLAIPAEVAPGLAYLRCLRAVGNLYPQDKLSPALSQADESAPDPLELRVSLFEPSDFATAASELSALGARLLSEQPSPTGAIRVNARAKDLVAIAGLARVRYVEPAEPPRRVASAVAGSRSNAQAAPSVPYGVDGTGVRIGVWDGGLPEASHPDLGGRVTVVDAAALDLHATQVAGVIAGSGRASPAARGQAPAATLFAFDFAGDPVQECRDAAVRDGLSIANHSWGHAIGFQAGGTCGQTYCNTGGQHLFGFYSGAAQDFDQMVAQTGLIVVKAAGDDRDDGNDASNHDGLQVSGEFYETMEDQACAKNVLTVGATTDADAVASYSSWGPCDDGRVKPELVAAGDKVVAPAPGGAYQPASGTSMAAANVSGQVALFLDAHSRYGGGVPRASRVKAIALNSCTDVVAAPYAGVGPDYASGFGLLDVQQMLALAYTELHAPFVKQTFSGSFSSSGETTHTTFSVGDARQELRVTLAWTDPQGSLLAGPALVNDLDLRLIGPDGAVWMPWVLDPANPSAAASRGNNAADPVEQVALTRAGVIAAGKTWPGTWRVIIRAGTIAQAPQAWDLAATVALTARPSGSDPVVTISNPPANASGRQKVIASVTAATGRTVVAVQYRVGAGAWLAMLRNQSTGSYESVVDYVVTTSAGELLTVRAVDDTVREGRATRSLTHVFSDDHPNLASGTGPADALTPNGAAGQGVIEPAGSSPEVGDFFQVPLATGVRYQVEAAGADGVALELTLYSTDGTTVLTRTTGAVDVSGTQSVARLLDTTVASDGTYYVRVSQGGFTAPEQPRYDYTVRVFTVTGVARIAASPTSGSPSFTVTFSNRSFGPLSSFLWDFGDGVTSTAISPTHAYASSGVYQARMTADGQFASNVVDITATGTADDHPGNRFESFGADDILTVDGPALPGVVGTSSDNDFFKLTLANGQSVILDVLTGTLDDSRLTVQTSSGGDPGGIPTGNDDPAPTYVRSSHLTFTAPSADTYLLKVEGPNGKTGSYSLRARTAGQAANLKVTAISAPSSLPVSQVALFSVTVSNSSTVPVTAPFKVGIATTESNVGFNSTFKIRREALYRDGIPANQSVTVGLALGIEITGSITFWGVVNSDHAVPETNVDDNLLSQGTAVSLTRRTRPPRLRAGPERSVAVNSVAGLNASATDPDGSSLTYSWRRLLGPASPSIVNATLADASVTPTAAGRYRFLVTASDGSGGTATAPVDVWAYETTDADFDVQTVTSGSGTTFTQRQTGRRLSFTGRNRGGHVAFVNRAKLKFVQGASDVSSGFVVRPVGAGPSFLLTGSGGTWDFDVDVLATSASGPNIVVHGVLEGTDAQTSQAKSDSLASGPLTVTVQAAATATIQPAVAPASIEPGQTILFTVPVRNSGDVSANALAATLTFGGAPLAIVPRGGSPQSVAAGATVDFGFDVSAPVTATAGPVTATFTVTGVDGATGFQLSSTNSSLAVLNVLAAPELKIVSFSVPRQTASLGQTFPATVTVRNSGGASILFTQQSLVLSGTSLTATGLTRTFSLAGANATTAIPFSLQAAAAGATTLTSAVFTARNASTNTPVGITSNLAAPVTVTVQTPPTLEVVAILPERLTATQGQSFQTTVTVRNTGGATARISRATASFGNSGLTAASISEIRSLAASAQTSFTFRVTAAAAGSTSIEGATFDAVDENSGGGLPAPSVSAAVPVVTVLTPPLLKIVSITSPRSVISIGQQVLATVTLRNEGQTSVLLTTARMVSSSGALTSTTLTTAVTLGGNSATAAFGVLVTGVSQGTALLTTATFTARNALSSQPVGLGGNLASAPTIVVQPVPSLRLDSIQVGPTTVSSGQTVRATVTVTNLGVPSVAFTGETLVFSGSTLQMPVLAISRMLAGGAQTSFTFEGSGVGVGTSTVTSATFSATDANSGKPVKIQSNGASAAAVLVQSRPGFKILSITAARTTFSLGQSASVTVTVRNDGELPVDITQERLTLSGGSFTAPALNLARTLVTGGAQTSFTFTVTAVSAGVSTLTSASFDATNSGPATPAPLVSNESVRTELVALAPPELRILSVAPARTLLSVGQAMRVTATLRNDGGAAVRIGTLTLPAARLQVAPLTPTFDIPGGGASAAFTFAATGASAGSFALTTVTVSATDAGNGLAAPVVSNAAQSITVTVQSPPALGLSSLATARTTVLQGELFDVTATVSNQGQATALLTREELVATNGRVRPPVLNLARSLAGGESAMFVFRTLAESAGVSSITSAVLAATDANSGLAAPLAANSAAPLGLTVEAAPLLRLVSIAPSRLLVTRGQAFAADVTLRNDGSADALVSAANLVTSNANLATTTLVVSRTIAAAGGTSLFSFPITATSDGATSLTSATFAAVNSSTSRTAPLVANLLQTPPQVLVQAPPVLRVVGLGTASPAVSLGKTVSCTVDILNAGGARAHITSLALAFSNGRLVSSPAGFSTDVSGGQTVRLTISATAVETGTVSLLDAIPAAVDANTGLDVPVEPSSAQPVELTVKSQARVELVAIDASRVEVTLGQSFPVTVTFSNAGEDPAELSTATLSVTGSSLAIPGRARTASLPGRGATTSYVFIAKAVSIGNATLSTATVSALDSDGTPLPLAANRASPVAVQVQAVPSLRLASLSLSPTASVTRAVLTTGQSFSVFVTLRHEGGAGVDLSAASLVFNATQLSLSPLALSTGLPAAASGAGGQLTLEFPARVASSGGRSVLSTAVVTARDTNTGAGVRLSANQALPLVLDIQPRGLVRLTGLATSRSTVTVGQRFNVSATIENAGTAALAVKRVQLVASGPAADVPVLVEPITLTRLASRGFSFDVVSRAAGSLRFTSAVVDALDVNSGEVERLRANLAVPVSVAAQLPPALELIAVGADRAVVSAGDMLVVTVALRNTGGASALVAAARLSGRSGLFTTGTLSNAVTVAATSTGAPATVFSFNVTAAATGAELFDGIDVDARDANTGGSLAAALRTTQAAAAVRVLPVNRRPVASIAGPDALVATDGRPVTAVYDASASADPDGDPFSLFWSAAGGAGVSIASAATTRTAVTFSSTGVKGLRLRVTDLRGGLADATYTVTVTANASPVPDAGPDRQAAAGFPVRLEGRATDSDQNPIGLRWYQVGGVAQTLVASGAAVAFTPSATGVVRLALEASDGRGGVATDAVSVEALAPRTWRVSLLRGQTLISPPIRALRSDGEPLTCQDLLQAAEASFLVSTREQPPGRSTFRTLLAGSGEDTPLEPGKGYLLSRRGEAATLALAGLPWPGRLPTRALAAGSHLIGVIVGPGSPSDSEDLRSILGARFVGRVRASAGTGRLELHIPQRSPLFEIRTGLGYLVTIPAARDVVIPEGIE